LADSKPITSFRLPNSKTIEVYVVKLATGQTVVRSREELEHAPVTPSPVMASDPRR